MKIKFKTILGIALILLAVSLTGAIILKWLIYRGTIVGENIFETLSSWGLVIAILLSVIVMIALIINKYFFGDKERDKDSPKDLVDVDDAIEIIKEKFIENTEIPYRVNPSGNKPRLIPLKDYYVEIQNTNRFPEPSTSQFFLRFEIKTNAGTHAGINTCITPLDMGLEWIKKNWRSTLKKHTFEEIHKINRNEPLATPQSEEMKIEMFKLEKIAEGYEDKDLQYLNEIKKIAGEKAPLAPPAPTPEQIEAEVIKKQMELDAKTKKQGGN